MAQRRDLEVKIVGTGKSRIGLWLLGWMAKLFGITLEVHKTNATGVIYQRSSAFYELSSQTSVGSWITYMGAALGQLELDLYHAGLLENKLLNASVFVSNQHVDQKVVFAVDVDQDHKIVCMKCGQVWSKHFLEDFATYKCP